MAKMILSTPLGIDDFIDMINKYFYSNSYSVSGNKLINKNKSKDFLDKFIIKNKQNRYTLYLS